MQILLDTYIIIWYFEDSPDLASNILIEILNPRNQIYVSIVSFWEISIKMGLNKWLSPIRGVKCIMIIQKPEVGKMLYFLENLLKLPKVGVQNVVQEGEIIFLILECVEEKVKCKDCENLTDELHQTRYVMVRDLPISGQIVYLKVPRRKFYCKHCQHYFTEDLEFIKPRRKYTERYEKYICQRVNASSIEQVKREESLSWSQVDGIHKHQCEALKKSWDEVKRLGVDEITKRKGRKNYATVLSDLDKGILIEVIDSHEQTEIIETLMKQPLEVREKVVYGCPTSSERNSRICRTGYYSGSQAALAAIANAPGRVFNRLQKQE